MNSHAQLELTTTGLVWKECKIVCHVLQAITVPKAQQLQETVHEELSMMY